MILSGTVRIIDHGKDLSLDHIIGEHPWPSAHGVIGGRVDAGFVEAGDLLLEAALGDPGMLAGQFIGGTAKKQMHGVEPLLRFLIGTAIDRQLQFHQGAGFRIGKLSMPSDSTA